MKSFPSKNNLCPDTVVSKDEYFSANIFVKPPSPILAELPVSTRIYITFFTKRSVNSEGSLQTARPTDGCEEKCYRQKHPWTFPNLKIILKPLSVSKLFCFMLSLCHSFLGKPCNNFLLDQKGQHQRAVWLQSALSSAPLLTITIESKNEDLQMCQMHLLKVSTPNLFCRSFCNILRF